MIGAGAGLLYGGIASGIGSLAGGALGYFGQSEANSANADIAAANRAFQADMTSRAHQIEVEDLKKAGLNPILSAGGSGASVPSGAMATMQNTMEGFSNSARDIGRIALDVQRAKADIGALEANAKKASADAGRAGAEQTNAELARPGIEAANRAAKASADIAEANSWSAQNRVQWEKDHPEAARWMGPVKDMLGITGGLGVTAGSLKYLLTPKGEEGGLFRAPSRGTPKGYDGK